jgi:hypothetical protein
MQPKFFQPGWATSRPSSAQLNETLEICCDHPALASDLFFLHVDHHRFLLPLHSVFCASVLFANFTPVCCQFYTTPSVSSRVVVCMVFFSIFHLCDKLSASFTNACMVQHCAYEDFHNCAFPNYYRQRNNMFSYRKQVVNPFPYLKSFLFLEIVPSSGQHTRTYCALSATLLRSQVSSRQLLVIVPIQPPPSGSRF